MSTERSLRGDIQGLRAVAVGLVLLFHVWPNLVPGGYVGVDVFFVISGYLIVGSLFREAERNGRVSLVDFYTRRIRRLMPAASVVLAFCFGGMFLWLPEARWEDTLVQIAASALYAENWYLAWAAVDYLAAENAPSPVQHFWSLSIEEQFYIVWPLVMLAVLWIGRKSGLRLRSLVLVALGLVFAGSLAASIFLTATDPGRAYFVTHTRAWELALGGLLAVALPHLRVADILRAVLCLVGLAAIVVSGITYGGVPFPGYSALLPTLGTALILLAGDFRIGAFAGLNTRPMRYIGDISYSLYLWHWPLIVFYLATGREIGLWTGLGLIAAAVVVSHISYHLVEQRFRHPKRRGELRPLPYGFASIAVIVALSGTSYWVMARQMPASALPADEAGLYPGPAALLENAPVPEGVPLVPTPTQLLRDRAVVYDSGCHQKQANSDAKVCEFGDLAGEKTVALVGSSHSVNWLPAFDLLGRKNGWRILSITKSACGFATSGSDSCTQWHDNVVKYLADHPVDVIAISEFASKNATDDQMQLIADRWQRFADMDIPILAIGSIPHLATEPGDCLPDDIDRCVIPRASAERPNTIATAVDTVPGVQVINMNDAICSVESCGPVVGNLVVYRDKHHLTATYSRALAPYLETRLSETLPELLPIRDGEIESRLVAMGAPAAISCGPIGHLKAFSREYDPAMAGKHIELRNGDWRKRQKNFERWDGSIEGDNVTITGEYREGRGGLKKIDFSGKIEDGQVILSGKRGPRDCTVTWPVENARPSAT